eukprot:11174920-Lingulodinium_polyedra.AAC.1
MVASWNACGGIRAEDGQYVLRDLEERLGKLEVVLLQECGRAKQSLDLRGFVAFEDGQQRGNSVLVSDQLAPMVASCCIGERAVVVGLQADIEDHRRHLLASCHLPDGSG